MRSLLRALRLLVVLGLLLPAGAPVPGDPAPRAYAAWSSAGPVCAEVSGEGRLCTWAAEAPPDTDASPAGFGGAGSAASARCARAQRCILVRSLDALSVGALPAAQAFLRVNGSANAHGARA